VLTKTTGEKKVLKPPMENKAADKSSKPPKPPKAPAGDTNEE